VIQRRVYVTGTVQGVGFRAATYREAKLRGGLKGWVRNLEDGRVEAVFLGPESAVLHMVSWCRKGPSSARVLNVDVHDEDPDLSLGEFGVTPDA
jgi:acylphosphatase